MGEKYRAESWKRAGSRMGRRLRVLWAASGGEARVPLTGRALDLRGVLAAASTGPALAAGSRVGAATGGVCCLAPLVPAATAWRGAILSYHPISGKSAPHPLTCPLALACFGLSKILQLPFLNHKFSYG